MSAWVAATVWAVSVLGPIALFAASLHSAASLRNFWVDTGPAVRQSLGVATSVGAVVAGIGAAAWIAWSCGGRAARSAAWACTVSFCIAGLTPGVLVGRAVLGSWAGSMSPDWVRETTLIIIIAHVARFGFLGVLAGAMLAGIEGRATRDARVIDGGAGLAGWARACLAARWTALLGVGAAAAMLSMHEIESAVIVLPPGAESLAQQLLEHLHYSRDERLAATAVNLMVAGTLVAMGAAAMIGAAGREKGGNRRYSGESATGG